jgi:hypothetical protein
MSFPIGRDSQKRDASCRATLVAPDAVLPLSDLREAGKPFN